MKHFDLDEQFARQACINSALRIYHLAKAYQNTFTLRRAPYLFSYALFSAATVVPYQEATGTGDVARRDLIVFFWNALLELQNGSNFGLRRPIKIMRDFMERAGVDIAALANRPENPPRSLPASAEQASNLHHHVGEETGAAYLPDIAPPSVDDYTILYPDMFTDNLDWLDCSVDQSFTETDDMLYGLFRSS